MARAGLTRFAWLSIGAALLTIGLKAAAYLLTHSVGLLSDAVEALVNLVGGLMALAMLTLAALPADEEHAWGHSKAEYFSSGAEGALILVAALSIAFAAVRRFMAPQPLDAVGLGLLVSVSASLVNLGAALVILRAGRRHGSITLEANARHLLTDVWTSVGVIVGVGAVAATGWLWLDPIIALAVAANIVWTGLGIVRRSASGLMDAAVPAADRAALAGILDRYVQEGVAFHALRTRQAGARCFVSVHVLVPGAWTVQRGHDLLERFEAEIRAALPGAHVSTHLEPVEDPASWRDADLDREGSEGPGPG